MRRHALIRLVSVPPRASEWLNVAVKLSKLRLERREEQEARVGGLPGGELPKSTVSDGVSCWLPTWVPTIWKVSSRPLAFWTICGWAVVIERLLAVPPPTLVTSRPSVGGLARLGDLRDEGSSPMMSCGRK